MVESIVVELIQIVAISFLLTIVVEVIARASFKEALAFLFKNSLKFTYNITIIMATMSLSLLTKRRLFVYLLVSILWIVLAIVEYFIIKFRGIPFVGNDILVLKFGLSISKEYISLPQFIAIIVSIFIVWKAMTKAWISEIVNTIAIPYGISVPVVLIIVIPFILVTIKGLKDNPMDEEFSNLRDIYDNYGLVYSFYISVITSGIRPTYNYLEKTVKTIKNELNDSEKDTTEINPNIIMVQLESFFDPSSIKVSVKFITLLFFLNLYISRFRKFFI